MTSNVALRPDWPIETERLLLRPFEAGDLDAYHVIQSDEGVARYQGRGYATEAARPFLAFAFGPRGLHRVVGRTEARNAASARVLEKLGMRLEAHHVENEWVKGEWQSELVYAILASEWAA
jgi:RimJ/RimL family protein N-acetyltransferase